MNNKITFLSELKNKWLKRTRTGEVNESELNIMNNKSKYVNLEKNAEID